MANVNLSKLFMDSELADVIFVVDNEEIPGHRVILASTCPYFKKLLYGSFKESKSDRVELNGTSAKIFKEVIRFIYLAQLQIKDWNIDDLLTLLSLAHEYQFSQLFSEVIKALEQQPLNIESFKLVNSAAAVYDSVALEQKCASFIDEKIQQFLRQHDLETFTGEFICIMFESPQIQNCDQDELLDALFEWKKDHSSSEILCVFPKICWNKVSPTMNDILLKEFFSNIKHADEFRFWNQRSADMAKKSVCVARVENNLLLRDKKETFALSDHACSICCCLYSGYIYIWFKTDRSRIEIPVKKLEFDLSNHLMVSKINARNKAWGEISMSFSEKISNNNCFKYNATISDITPIYCFQIVSENLKTITEIRVQNLIIH